MITHHSGVHLLGLKDAEDDPARIGQLLESFDQLFGAASMADGPDAPSAKVNAGHCVSFR